MKAAVPEQMTAEEFVAWAMDRPDGEHYELVGGHVVAMSPERAVHVRTKQRAVRSLEAAMSAAGVSCEVFPDGMSVRIDDSTVFEPDAVVNCGAPLDDDAVFVEAPVIIVEVVSPSSGGVDTGEKFQSYFRLPSLRHYLILNPRSRVVTHHARDADGKITSRILGEGELTLDPPCLTLDVTALFPSR